MDEIKLQLLKTSDNKKFVVENANEKFYKIVSFLVQQNK
jgi:hypothetical protein